MYKYVKICLTKKLQHLLLIVVASSNLGTRPFKYNKKKYKQKEKKLEILKILEHRQWHKLLH